MIEGISLINFQGHRHTKIDLHRGINAIIGGSTAGKSSIIRSLNWIYSNRPTGNGVVSYWNRDKKGEPVDETSACIVLGDKVVKRIKDATRNGYDVNEEELGAIGQGVPDKVLNALDLSDISFQSQHSSHFLLSQTAGEVSTFLNTVLNMSVIDETLTKVNEQNRAAKKKDEAIDEEITTITKQLQGLSFLDDLVLHVADYNRIEKAQVEVTKKIDDLQSILSIISTKKEQITKQSKYVDSLKDPISKASVLIDKIATVTKTINTLSSIIDDIATTTAAIEKASSVVALKPLVVEAVKLIDSIAALDVKIRAINTITTSIKSTREAIATAEDKLIELRGKLPDGCPACGSTKEHWSIL